MSWRERIEILMSNPNLTPRSDAEVNEGEVFTFVDLSADWPSCAIGERRELFEQCGFVFTPYGCPSNGLLDHLGMEFFHAIDNADYSTALSVLDKLDAIVAAKLQPSAAPRSSSPNAPSNRDL